LPISLDLKAAVAYYSNETTSKGEISWGPLTGTADLSGLKFKGLGYLIGGGLNLNITRSLNLSFNGTYRIAKLPLTEVKNIEGAYEAYEGEGKIVSLKVVAVLNEVEENTFKNGDAGLYAYNNGEAAGLEIYKNYFGNQENPNNYNMIAGTIVVGKNSNWDNQNIPNIHVGLQTRCNTYSSTQNEY